MRGRTGVHLLNVCGAYFLGQFTPLIVIRLTKHRCSLGHLLARFAFSSLFAPLSFPLVLSSQHRSFSFKGGFQLYIYPNSIYLSSKLSLIATWGQYTDLVPFLGRGLIPYVTSMSHVFFEADSFLSIPKGHHWSSRWDYSFLGSRCIHLSL